MIQIQDFVSRTKAISNALTQKSWESDGITNFFTLNVPFSYSTSHTFAAKLLKVIESYDRKFNKERIRIADIGSGTGLLGYRILEQAYKSKSPVAKKLDIKITEFSQDMLDSIKSNHIMARYESQLSYELFNLFTDSVTKLDDCDFILMIYVLDISAQHLEYDGEQFHEWKVSANIREDDYVLDTSVFPPRLHKGKAILPLFKEALEGEKSNLCTKLGDVIQEELKRFPLNLDTMDDRSKALLSKYFSNKTSDIKLNFCPAIYKFIEDLIQNINKKNQCGIIFDFGVPNQESNFSKNEAYMAQYGIGSYYTLHFPLIHHIADTHKVKYFQTHFDSGHSQWCILYPKSMTMPTLKKTFQEKDAVFTESILKDLETWQQQGEGAKERLQERLEHLPDSEANKHSVLLWSAKFYKDTGQYERCYERLDKLFRYNGSMGLAGYHVKLEALNAQGKFEKAYQLSKQLDQITKNHVGILYQRCFSAGQIKGYEAQFILAVKQFLKVSDHYVPWRFLLAVIAAYQHLGMNREAKAFLLCFSQINKALSLGYDADINEISKAQLTLTT